MKNKKTNFRKVFKSIKLRSKLPNKLFFIDNVKTYRFEMVQYDSLDKLKLRDSDFILGVMLRNFMLQ